MKCSARHGHGQIKGKNTAVGTDPQLPNDAVEPRGKQNVQQHHELVQPPRQHEATRLGPCSKHASCRGGYQNGGRRLSTCWTRQAAVVVNAAEAERQRLEEGRQRSKQKPPPAQGQQQHINRSPPCRSHSAAHGPPRT